MIRRLLLILSICICFIISVGCKKIDSVIEDNSSSIFEEENKYIPNIDKNDIEENNNEEGEALEYFWQTGITDDTAMVIVNNITNEEYNTLNKVENIILYDTTEGIVVIAAMDNIDMEIWSIEYSGDSIVEEEMIHKRENMKVNEAIKIETYIPEGLPNCKIKGSSSRGDFEYIIQYNGINGGDHLEYVSYGIVGSSDEDEPIIKDMTCRLFLYDIVKMKEYYIDKEIEIEDKAVIKALTKELQNTIEYGSDFMELSNEVEVNSATIENGILSVIFSEDCTLNTTLEADSEEGFLKTIADTYGYNLGVDKVSIYFGDELYKSVDVDYSDVEELN